MIIPKDREHRRTVLETLIFVAVVGLLASFVPAAARGEQHLALESRIDEVIGARLEAVDDELTARAERQVDVRAVAKRPVRPTERNPSGVGTSIVEGSRTDDVENPG